MTPFKKIDKNLTHQDAESQSDTSLPETVEHSSAGLKPVTSHDVLRRIFRSKEPHLPALTSEERKQPVYEEKNIKKHPKLHRYFIISGDSKKPVISGVEYDWLKKITFAESGKPVDEKYWHTLDADLKTIKDATGKEIKSFVYFIEIDGEKKEIMNSKKNDMKAYMKAYNKKYHKKKKEQNKFNIPSNITKEFKLVTCHDVLRRIFRSKKPNLPELSDAEREQPIYQKKNIRKQCKLNRYFIISGDSKKPVITPVISGVEYDWVKKITFAESGKPVDQKYWHTLDADIKYQNAKKTFNYFVTVDGEKKYILNEKKILNNPKTSNQQEPTLICSDRVQLNTHNYPDQHTQAPPENPDDSTIIKITQMYNPERLSYLSSHSPTTEQTSEISSHELIIRLYSKKRKRTEEETSAKTDPKEIKKQKKYGGQH